MKYFTGKNTPPCLAGFCCCPSLIFNLNYSGRLLFSTATAPVMFLMRYQEKS